MSFASAVAPSANPGFNLNGGRDHLVETDAWALTRHLVEPNGQFVTVRSQVPLVRHLVETDGWVVTARYRRE